MKRKLLVATGLMALTALAGSPLAAHAKSNKTGRVDVRATLVGATAFPTAQGHARFRQDNPQKSTFKADVEDVNLPAGTMVDLFVDGTQVGPAVPLGAEVENDSKTRSHGGSDNSGDNHGGSTTGGDDDNGTAGAPATTSEAKVELSSRHGDQIPAAHTGSLVQWETTDGTVIASGMLG